MKGNWTDVIVDGATKLAKATGGGIIGALGYKGLEWGYEKVTGKKSKGNGKKKKKKKKK